MESWEGFKYKRGKIIFVFQTLCCSGFEGKDGRREDEVGARIQRCRCGMTRV